MHCCLQLPRVQCLRELLQVEYLLLLNTPVSTAPATLVESLPANTLACSFVWGKEGPSLAIVPKDLSSHLAERPGPSLS